MDTNGEITIVEGVEVRRVKPGIYVREDEWRAYLKFNECLSLSYMRKHEPFDRLPPAYFPYPERDHRPPKLFFGFPIMRDCGDFRRIALEQNLAPPEECRSSSNILSIMGSVVRHINDMCGLERGHCVTVTGVLSRKANVILELKSNYRQLVPEGKMDGVIRVLKELLPGTEPQWYLEADIDLKPIHAVPMSMFEWSQPPGVQLTYSRVIAFNEVAPFRTWLE